MEKNGIAAAADHSRVKNIERGIVWVLVDHPGWKMTLQTKQSKLLSDFRRRFPDIDISGLSILLCKPGELTVTEPETPAVIKAEKQVENSRPEKTKKVSDIQVKDTDSTGYEKFKDGGLKETLMRIEQAIIEKEAETGEG